VRPPAVAHPASETASTGAPVLTFNWQRSRWFKDPLLPLLLVSALGHLLLFMLLQVVSTEKVTAPDREREMQFLSAEISEHKALLDAVEAETPLAALSHQLLPVESLLSRPYASPFIDSKPAPREAFLWKNPATVPLPKASFPSIATPSPKQVRPVPFEGRVVVDDGLKGRLQGTPPGTPSPPAGKTLEQPEFLLGVSAPGEVKFVVLQKSSGDGEADRTAEHFLRRIVFTASDRDLEWGHARLEWRVLH